MEGRDRKHDWADREVKLMQAKQSLGQPHWELWVARGLSELGPEWADMVEPLPSLLHLPLGVGCPGKGVPLGDMALCS